MVDRRFELNQRSPGVRFREDGSATAIQEIELNSPGGKSVAEIIAYPDEHFFAIWFKTGKTEAELTEMVERCITTFERCATEADQGIPDLLGGYTDPTGLQVNTQRRSHAPGIRIIAQEDDQNRVLEVNYRRPLNWDQVKEVLGGKQFSLCRFDTPVGAFVVMQRSGGFQFGIITHLRETSAFAQLLADSSSYGVPIEEAQQFIDKALSIFPSASQE